MVLNKFTSNNVGYCYDSCHHINYAPDEDLLGMYGNRLMAIHYMITAVTIININCHSTAILTGIQLWRKLPEQDTGELQP